MRNDLLLILQSCDSIKLLNDEFNKRFGWLRFFDKIKCNKLKKMLLQKIDELANDKWTVDYLLILQKTLLAYYSKLENYLDDISIQDPYVNLNLFKPMYFTNVNDNHVIILEIVANSIQFTVFDTIKGDTFKTSSAGEVSPSQNKMETICKQKIIAMLKRYLNGITSSPQSLSKQMMEDVAERYKNI